MKALFGGLIVICSCWANYPDQISVLLEVGATSLTVHNTGIGGSDVGLSFNPGVNQRVRFSLMRVYLPPPAGSTYTACANPCTVSLNRNWGQQYEFIEYVDNAGNPLSPPTKSAVAPAYSAGCGVGAVLPQIERPVTATSPLPMPIEVIGQDCYVTHVRLPLVNGHASTGLRLFARIHAPIYNSTLKFDGKVSVQVNSGGWLTYSNSNNSLTAIDEMRWYSLGTTFQGAGTPIPLFSSQNKVGGFAQVRDYMMAIPDGTINPTDTNVTIGWRFNGTEGQGSGFRVLAMNIVEADEQINSITVTSNSAVATANAAHGYNSGDSFIIWGAPGMYMRFNGLRTISNVGSATTLTFTPCGTGNPACTSPNGTYAPPVNRDTSGWVTMAQPHIYSARAQIAPASFTQAVPDSAGPAAANATRGGNLFKFGNAAGTAGQFDQLASPNTPYLNNGFHNATCGGSAGCHTTTGGDLKYINESNYVIKQRTIFHGFQDQDGDDIAAYIRSIATVTVPANARPWNAPFQPGPGISTGTANAFFAGCGADCVVTYGYADLYEYLAPGGSQASWAPGGRTIETRDIPSPYLYPDYKFWLPAVHPADGFPLGNFMTDVAQTDQAGYISGITTGDFATYKSNNYAANTTHNLNGPTGFNIRLGTIYGWLGLGHLNDGASGNFGIHPLLYNSLSGKNMINLWELWNEKGLLALDSQRQVDLNGSTSVTGCYVPWGIPGQQIFNNGAHKYVMAYSGVSPDGMRSTYDYHSNVWYVAAGTISFNNCVDSPNSPIDNGYYNAFVQTQQEYRPQGWMILLPQLLTPQYGAAQHWLYSYQAIGTFTTSDGTHLVWASGTHFTDAMQGNVCTFGVTNATVTAFTDSTHLTVGTNIGGAGSYVCNSGGRGLDWSPMWSKGITYETRFSYPWFTIGSSSPSTDWISYVNAYLTNLNALIASKSVADWDLVFTSAGASCTGGAASAWSQASARACDNTAMLLTLFKVWGADATQLTTLLNWAKSIPSWSGHNFDNDIVAANDGPGTQKCVIGGVPQWNFNDGTPLWWRCSNM